MNRLFLISNRLPITIKRSEDGEYTLKKSSGGLVSGIAGLTKTQQFLWYGWPGLQVPEEDVDLITNRLRDEHAAFPVFLDDELADKHYNGLSNEILWAILHYHPGEINFDESAWEAYQQVNQLFADRICDDLEDGDLVWVHDYHLMLLPRMIRDRVEEKKINVKIGWFLHTSFPSSEIWRVLPVRRELLEGVLSADLLGFHTYDYVRHFISSCNRLLAAGTTPNSVEFNGRKTKIGAFPIGIDYDSIVETLGKEETQERVAHFHHHFRNSILIIGCDRLDYIKGVPHKLHTFQFFLERHPELVGKVQLIQIAIPSREDVGEYQALKRSVNELVGQINGKFGTIDFNPVHLKHTSVPQSDLLALFSISDVCLVSSTRDGMNLVAYEYIACQNDRHGVLVLSEFAGCAQNFANGAVICNPWNIEESSNALYRAVTMAKEERKANQERLVSYVSKYTSSWWGESYIDELVRIAKVTEMSSPASISTIATDAAYDTQDEQDGDLVSGDEQLGRPSVKVGFQL